MSGQYKDGLVYPHLPKMTEGYHGDYWTADDITGYALDFWAANITVNDEMVSRAIQAVTDFQQVNTHIGEDVSAYRRRMQRAALLAALSQPATQQGNVDG